jgi:DNA-binding beta-propeller fold protein YncE
MFDLKTGAPAGEYQVPDAAWINDIAVDSAGTIYATLTGTGQDPTSWKILKIAIDKKTKAYVTTVFAQGAPMNLPNGIALDPAGNIVMVNIGTPDVITFSPKGKVLKTEKAAMSGNDGLVIMADGTKYVSSVRFGGVSKIGASGVGELIATGIPVAASMCYDSGANQLVIPLNPNNALAFIKLN